jgi:protein phosphatase
MDTQYDVIGDLHGNLPLLRSLTLKLGYSKPLNPPPGRKMVFVGDLADRGPMNLDTILAVRDAVLDGRALAVLGNHDYALLKWLRGEDIPRKGGIDETISEILQHHDSTSIRKNLLGFYQLLPIILKLDGGKLVVVHAGIEDRMLLAPITEKEKRFILFGDVVGKRSDGKTLRRDWAADYGGDSFVAYGHTPQDIAQIRGNTINLDLGVYITGRLAALQWPDMNVIFVQ